MNSSIYTAINESLSQFFATEATDARRAFHGRGHFFEGLEHINIDWYNPLLLITAYDPIANIDELVAKARAVDTLGQIKSIVLQNRHKQGAPAEVVWGEEMREFCVKEGSLVFEVHPGSQQNVGLFLDMRPLRTWLQKYSEGKNVLNMFAYTCSLSVAALAGGARQVTSVDMSRTSIRWGEQNHRLNKQDLRCVRSIPHNLFKSWGRINQYGRYDTIIIDPPTLQRGSFDVEKNYGTIIKKLKNLCHPGADIIATLNSPFLGPEYLVHRFQRFAPQCRLIGEMPASPEFKDKYPERALKIFHFRMK